MKKILSITVMLLIVSLAFFSCDTREFSGSPAELLPITYEGADAGGAFSLWHMWTKSATVPGLAKSGNKVNIKVTNSSASANDGPGGQSMRFAIPNMYQTWEISVKLTKDDDLGGGNAKLGVKNASGADYRYPTPDDYIEFQWNDGLTGDDEKDILTLRGYTDFFTDGYVYLVHNMYGGGGTPPVNYEIEFVGVTFYPTKIALKDE